VERGGGMVWSGSSSGETQYRCWRSQRPRRRRPHCLRRSLDAVAERAKGREDSSGAVRVLLEVVYSWSRSTQNQESAPARRRWDRSAPVVGPRPLRPSAARWMTPQPLPVCDPAGAISRVNREADGRRCFRPGQPVPSGQARPGPGQVAHPAEPSAPSAAMTSGWEARPDDLLQVPADPGAAQHARILVGDPHGAAMGAGMILPVPAQGSHHDCSASRRPSDEHRQPAEPDGPSYFFTQQVPERRPAARLCPPGSPLFFPASTGFPWLAAERHELSHLRGGRRDAHARELRVDS
jgi:hypothetical protein